MKKLKGLSYVVALIAVLIVAACVNTDKRSKDSIVIGVATPQTGRWTQLANGINLAVEQINASGGVLGKTLKIDSKNDEGSIDKGLIIAENFSEDPNITAVIGHAQSHISLPASSIYEASGKLMLTPGSTSSRITNQNFHNIFRLIPDNKAMGAYLAQYTKKLTYKKVIVFYSRNEYGRDLANAYEKAAWRAGIDIVDRRSYIEQSARYHFLFQFWQRHFNYDAMLVIGSLPEGAEIIKQIRDVGITVPIISADAMNDKTLISLAKNSAEGMVVLAFSEENKQYSEALFKFNKQYQARFKEAPDEVALLGYDAINLIAHAITETKSTSPEKLANYLHSMSPWQGVIGDYQFDDQGNLISPNRLHLKKVTGGKLIPGEIKVQKNAN